VRDDVALSREPRDSQFLIFLSAGDRFDRMMDDASKFDQLAFIA
jgi:hypothetical protein